MVYILTEAGDKYGYGHLMRCIALAQGFQDRGVEVVFFIKGAPEASRILQGFLYHYIDWSKEIVPVKGHIVILDSYYADIEICNKLYNESMFVLFIDDYNRIRYPGGYVLNSVIGGEKIDYPDNPNITYLLGPVYQPLRREFWVMAEKDIREYVEKVLITFGGSDTTNMTPQFLKILNEKYPLIEKHVIIGNSFCNIDEIRAAADDKTSLIYQPDDMRMKMEMMNCDIAITAAGQTIAELARVGVPSYAVCVADNQRYSYENWRECGFLLNSTILKTMPDLSIRKKIYEIGRSLVDGMGVKRITELFQNG